MRAAKRPAAPQCDVNAQAKFPSRSGGKANRFDVFVGEKWQIVEASSRVIERKRVQGGDLDSTNAFRLHLFELSLQFGLRDCRAKPPPAHHNPAVIWRIRE